MIRSAAILMAVSAIVGPGPANAPTTANGPVVLPPMTLRINADGTFEVTSASKIFETPLSDVTKNPAYLGPGPAAFPGTYVRDAVYREPHDRAELIARPCVTGGDEWLAGAQTSSVEPVLRNWRVREGAGTIFMPEPVPAAPK